VSQDFLLQVFLLTIFPQAFENPQIWGLTKFVTFADPVHVWQFADLGFADPIFFAIFGFAICWPNFVADLKLPQICKFFIFLLTNTNLKYSNSNLYQIKNSAKQTCRWLLDSFAIKGGNSSKKMLNSLCLMVKNLRVFNLQTGSPTEFADLHFADQSKKLADSHISEICGFANADWSQEFADLKNSCTATFANLPPVSMVVHLEVRIFPRIFELIQNDSNGILGGAWGKLIHEKKSEVENLVALSF
jgi:hypothetical protein